MEGGVQTNLLDVGSCDKRACVVPGLQDNGTCLEWWPTHCCDVASVESVDVTCGTFTYQISKVRSCACRTCVKKTKITGRAYGISNGTNIPFRHGLLYVHGEEVASTSSTGFFSFDVPKRIERIAITFQDSSGKFMETVKVLTIPEGVTAGFSIVIPLRPTPRPFNTTHGLEFDVGTDGEPPAASLSIPADSIMNDDGTPFVGTAHAVVHFVDPRSLEDVEAAYGDLSTIDEDGNPRPIETYGMFGVTVENHLGHPLHVKSPIEMSIDPTVFNISTNKDGDLDLHSWELDPNSGSWIQVGQFRMEHVHTDHRRKLLAPRIIGTFPPRTLPIIQMTETKIGYTTRSVRSCNGDRWITQTVSTRSTVTKRDACVIRVQVYSDSTLTTLLPGATVSAATKDLDDGRYKSRDSKTTGSDGSVCMNIMCENRVSLYVEVAPGPVKLYASQHNLPPGYQVQDKNSRQLVEVEARWWGPSFNGPVWRYQDRAKCHRPGNNAFHIKFARIVSKPDTLTVAVGTKDNNDQKLSWYPHSRDDKSKKSCFIKLKFTVSMQILTLFNLRFNHVLVLSSFI
jgi:hypothetical protein